MLKSVRCEVSDQTKEEQVKSPILHIHNTAIFDLNSAKKIGLKQNQMLKTKLKRWRCFAIIGQFAKTVVKQNGRF